MNRPPQKLEPLSAQELFSISEQLRDVLSVCDSAHKMMETNGDKQILVLYKSTILKTLKGLHRMRESVYQSWKASEMGSPLTEDSVSPRSTSRVKRAIRNTKKTIAKGREKK